jgi:hypothetical protein
MQGLGQSTDESSGNPARFHEKEAPDVAKLNSAKYLRLRSAVKNSYSWNTGSATTR